MRPKLAVQPPIVSEVAFFESGGERIRVDVYRPAVGGRHPAAILLHGSGGIHAFVESMINRYAEALADHGIVSFVVHYFDGTGDFTADESVEAKNYFRWVQEVRDAVTWVRNRPDVRANAVGIVGQSLGAWLAVGASSMDQRVSRIVLFGGGLEPFLADSIKRMPPTMMFHGDQDDVVPLSDANALAAFIRARRYPIEYHIVRGEGHDFSDSAATAALTRAARFLAGGRFRGG